MAHDLKPTFAIVGAVNHGKSSVASTLAEDDQIGVSDFPGETKVRRRFDCRDLFTLWDTPGFQDPRGMLREIGDKARRENDPLKIFNEFLTQHSSDDGYEAECELLRPLLAGAAILYVVDTSKDFEPLHQAEMELLCLTGRPRLAVLNPTSEPLHEQQWRTKLGQHFGAVHEFNAHHASAQDRAGLLRAMAAIADQWKSALLEAASAVEDDLKLRNHDAVQIMVELLESTLPYKLEKLISRDEFAKKDTVIEKTKIQFRADITEMEKKAHRELLKLFRHSRVKARPSDEELFKEDLFSEETWKLLGMPWWALAGIGSLSGGLAGAKGGALVGAHGELAVPSGIPTTVGLSVGAACGAILGGVSAAILGKNVAQPSVSSTSDVASSGNWFERLFKKAAAHASRTGTIITVGPQTGENFPYILLDRCIGLFCHLQWRTHARRDAENLSAADLKAELDRLGASTASWDSELKVACKEHVSALRTRKDIPKSEGKFRELLTSQLAKIGSI